MNYVNLTKLKYVYIYIYIYIYIQIKYKIHIRCSKIYQQNKKIKKSNNMVMNFTKISQKMKNKSLLRIEKNIIEREKILYYNYK